MPHTLYLAPSGAKVGLTSVALGLVRALDNRGVRVAFCKPVGQPIAKATGRNDPRISSAPTEPAAQPSYFVGRGRALISSESDRRASERVMRDFHESASDADVVVVEGLAHSSDTPFGATLNVQLVKTLSAQVILTGSLAGLSMEEFDERLEFSGSQYGGLEGGAVIGCIINHVPDPQKPHLLLRDDLAAKNRLLERGGFHLMGRFLESGAYGLGPSISLTGAKMLHEGDSNAAPGPLARARPNMLHTFRRDRFWLPRSIAATCRWQSPHGLKTPIAGLVSPAISKWTSRYGIFASQ
jgi:phosphate acetyltransferase